MVADLECPRCNCNDCEFIGTTTRWGLPADKWGCNFCGNEFTKNPVESTPEPASSIAYPVLRCPSCNSKEVTTSKTQPGEFTTRRHKCKSCGHPFKSVEPK